jgi:hypothetical protein
MPKHTSMNTVLFSLYLWLAITYSLDCDTYHSPGEGKINGEQQNTKQRDK